MHVFLDDSGDAGMKFEAGSTIHLVIAACVFTDPPAMEHASTSITDLRKSLGLAPTREFKYSKTSNTMKDDFFRMVKSLDFAIQAIIIDKRMLYSEHLREAPKDLQAYAISQLLSHTNGVITNAKLVIDGHDTRVFGASSEVYFRKKINEASPNTIRKVSFDDSTRNPLIQLADMVAGAVRRYEIGGPTSPARDHWMAIRRKFNPPIGNLWRFR